MSSESPSTIFSVFIISDKVSNQSWSSDTALSNFGHGDARSANENQYKHGTRTQLPRTSKVGTCTHTGCFGLRGVSFQRTLIYDPDSCFDEHTLREIFFLSLHQAGKSTQQNELLYTGMLAARDIVSKQK